LLAVHLLWIGASTNNGSENDVQSPTEASPNTGLENDAQSHNMQKDDSPNVNKFNLDEIV
jgi:hypothetical protein